MLDARAERKLDEHIVDKHYARARYVEMLLLAAVFSYAASLFIQVLMHAVVPIASDHIWKHSRQSGP